MKQKYFLRGMGVGIICATLCLFLLYSYKTSDARVVARAKELGMSYGQKDTEEPLAEEKKETESSEETEEKNGEETTEESVVESIQQETSAENITQEQTSWQPEETTERVVVSFDIPSGMNSVDVAGMLQQLGLIDDANAFDYYLMEHGLTQVLQYGSHELVQGMNYREIAQDLTGTVIEN